MLKIFLLFVFIFYESAAVINDGPCPDVKGIEHFNMTAFQRDRWYEIARYINNFEGKRDCVYAEHSVEKGRNLMKFYELIDNKYFESFNSYIDLNPNYAGVIDYFSRNMTEPEGVAVLSFTYLDIDYDKYAVLYRCAFDEKENKHQDNAWIISRTKKLEPDVKTKVEDFIKSNGLIDLNNMIWDHFEQEICLSV